MKFAQKLSLSMILLLAVSFSFGGYFMVRQNFQDALKTMLVQNEAQHAIECYALQTEILSAMAKGEQADNEYLNASFNALTAHAPDQHISTLYEKNGAVLATNSEKAVAAKFLQSDSYQLIKEQNDIFMVLSTELISPTRVLWLQSAYDVSPLFAARTRQMQRLWEMELVTLFLSGALIVWLSIRLTRPVSKLSQASCRIAEGDYSVRTALHTGDEIEQVSKSFDSMAQAVEEKMDALCLSVQQRDDFMGAFTHELKTPMTAILGYADTLRTMQCDPVTQQKAANFIFTEAKRVEMLSQKLLRLLGLTEEPVALLPVSLQSVFVHTATALTPIIKNTSVHWRSAEDIIVIADADLLCDLLYNLIHNAFKSNCKSGIECFYEIQHNNVMISVKDTGCGIPQQHLARITEPFYMVDKSRARAAGGSGMGLSLCQKIARLHGSELTFESTVGVGTTVSFSLKLQEEKNETKIKQ